MESLESAMSYAIKSAHLCRACNSSNIDTVLPFRPMPPGDKYVTNIDSVPRVNIPSDIQMCNDCGHIQMSGFTDPDYIYETYLSRPASTNSSLARLYQEYAAELKELADGGSIIEVGSNDGLFLENFKSINQKAVGIEPARNLCDIADSRGVVTINDYVSEDSVKLAVDKLSESPSIILANHSFSNVEFIQEWASNLTSVLKPDGYLVVQSFYQIDVLKEKLLENYNHEHLSYLTISSFAKFIQGYGLKLAKVKRIAAKGGSIRFYFKKTNLQISLDTPTLDFIKSEEQIIPSIRDYFRSTLDYIDDRKKHLNTILRSDSSIGASTLSAYGTSIGATVFSYQFEIEDLIQCFFDDDTLRQNRFSPGTGRNVLPGRGPEMNSYDKCIILAPLYADPIIKNNLSYLEHGGSFIKFWPNVEVISSL